MDKKFAVRFASYWAINTLVLSLVNTFFSDSFEIGNANLSMLPAGILSGFLLTVLLLLAKGLAKSKSFTAKGRIFMFLYYWGASTVGVWLIARIASMSGFGISHFTWAIVAGFAVALSNWLLRQALKGIKIV